jgi:alpha,alpha-trehalase
MIRYYFDRTHDIGLLSQALPLLNQEYSFWMSTHAVQLPGGHTLNHYSSQTFIPRPESYREDVANSLNMTPEQARNFYADTIAAAESGEDFSSRWFTQGNTLQSIATRSFVPVDLNSILYKFEANMAYFYGTVGVVPAVNYTQAMLDRRVAMDTFLWNAATYQWHDYFVQNNSQIIRSYPSNWLPIWAGAYDHSLTSQLFNSIVNSGLLQIGGILATQFSTGQQWDSPNVWAPHQSLFVQLLLNLNTPESVQLARTVAMRWINATYIGYQNSKMMHEKYNAFIPGAPGSGGEYPPQVGFGWTNGVTLEFLSMYG